MNKPPMTKAKVFYINIGNASSEEVIRIIDEYVKYIENKFDIDNVIFIPTREKETGWQINEEILEDLISDLKYFVEQKKSKIIQCPDCNGTKKYQGIYKTEDCKTCDGQGKVSLSKI